MTAAEPTYPRVPWRKSLIVRVIVLSAVLVLCLLGSVLVITQHYAVEVVQEMESQAKEMGDSVVLQIKEHPGAGLSDLEHDLMDLYPGFDEIRLEEDARKFSPFSFEPNANGQITKVAQVPLRLEDGREVLLTVRVTSRPQTDILRAFKNKYLITLAMVFAVTLCLMVYVIAKTLRPLADLSESCAQISSGRLQDVTVRRNAGEILALEQTFNRMVHSLREKEEMEAKLRQAQRVSALGTLAAGVAHDVRNPLNTIKLLAGHVTDMLREAPENEASIRQLGTIRNEVNRIEDIVSGFLSLAKERELQPEPRRVDALLDECLRLVRKDAETRGLQLTAELRAGETTLMLDPKQFTRAILNVLLNAMEACAEGGRVRLFSRVTDVAYEIEVRDNGRGITKEQADRAFDPYYTTKDTGTGLGLSTTRGIIEEHGGAITLNGAEGMGCQVLISLPLEKKPL